MLYRALRTLLFGLDAERAHGLTLNTLRVARFLRLLGSSVPPSPSGPVRLMGLDFPNRVGLAAGFDKNGVAIDALGALGFGFVEVGTVTPLPQAGNAKPRVFRLPRSRAVINRMGFPNEGVEALRERVRARKYTGIVGVNIGKNASTPLEQAADDYNACLKAVYDCADYVAINISSPNTVGLRQLQGGNQLEPLLESLLRTRETLKTETGRQVPLVVKLSPDMADEDLSVTASVLKKLGIDGVIATNTTIQRFAIAHQRYATETGGLSGAPLRQLSLAAVRKLRALLGKSFPIIGVGGIASLKDAQEMRNAGADLIQIYTGLVYEGPGLVRTLVRNLK